MAVITKLKNLSKEQEGILKGLGQMSDEAAGFYQDALLIMDSECVLTSKVNLMAHLTREIDSTFRHIFAPREIYELHPEAIAGRGNYASIVVAMGFENKKLADEWFKISKQFPSFAHRHGIKTRTMKEFKKLWDRYENILIFLLGSKYAFNDRISHLTSFEEPTKEMLKSLPYLLRDKQHEFQFFKNLSKAGWLGPLKENGLLKITPMAVLPSVENSVRFPEWLPARYLANIASQIDQQGENAIIEIMREFQQALLAGSVFVDEYTIYQFLKVIHALPTYVFSRSDAEFLVAFGDYWPIDHHIYESVISDDLVEKYLKAGEINGIVNLFSFILGFRKYSSESPFKKNGARLGKWLIPNLSHVNEWILKQRLPDVINLTGLPLVNTLAEILNDLSGQDSYEVNNIPSIEDSDQRTNSYGDWSWKLIDIVSMGGELLLLDDKKVFVQELLNSSVQIHQRIAFHLIRQDLEELVHLFWHYLGSNVLDGSLPIHELYLLIQAISKKVSEEKFKIMIKWIEEIKVSSDYLTAQDLEIHRVYRIRKYLYALEPGEANLQDKLREANSIYEKVISDPISHPEYDSYTTFSHGYDLPDDAGQLEDMNVEGLVARLSVHQKKDVFDTTGEGLGFLLEKQINNEPEKFLSDLTAVMKLPPKFIKTVFGALAAVVKNDGLDDWKNAIAVFFDRITKEDFEVESNHNHASLAIHELGSFLLELSEKDKNYHFTQDDITYLSGKVIGLLELERYQTLDHIDSDYVSFHLNSMEGKLFSALMNFSRVWSGMLGEEQNHRLPPIVLDYLDRAKSRKTEKEKGYSLGLGYHFAFVLYAEREWVYNNVAQLFPDENLLHKFYMLGGLLSPYTSVYRSVAEFLTKTGLGTFAAEYYLKDSGELAKLCKYALVEYSDAETNLLEESDSLISTLLQKGSDLQFQKLVAVCVQLSISQSRLLDLWRILIKKGESDTAMYAGMLDSLVKLNSLCLFNEEVFELLGHSVPYLDAGSSSYYLAKELTEAVDDQIRNAGTLLLEVWKSSKITIYVGPELHGFVTRLFTKDEAKLAEEICLYVGETGELGLKGLYDNYKLSQYK